MPFAPAAAACRPCPLLSCSSATRALRLATAVPHNALQQQQQRQQQHARPQLNAIRPSPQFRGRTPYTPLTPHALPPGTDPPSTSPARPDATSRSFSSLSSLDLLLGSSDEVDAAVDPIRPPASSPSSPASTSYKEDMAAMKRRQKESFVFQPFYVFSRDEEVEPPKVWPIITYGIYYLQIACYAAYLISSSVQGPEAAQQLVDTFTNDHLAVASSGEVYRFFTCALIHDGPIPLFVTLLSLVTLAPELEGLLGHSAFASVYFSAVLTASFVDSLLGILPVTQGAYPAIAGMVGALLAHQAKNWDLEIQVETARRSEHDQGQVSESLASVELLEGFVKLERPVTQEGRALMTVASTAVIAFQALLEVNQSASSGDTFTSWAGLVTAMFSGAILAWFMSPRYKVQRGSEASQVLGQGLEAAPAAGPSLGPTSQGAAGPSPAAAAAGAVARRFKSSDVVLTDETTAVQRGVVALGYNIALYLAIQSWLPGGVS